MVGNAVGNASEVIRKQWEAVGSKAVLKKNSPNFMGSQKIEAQVDQPQAHEREIQKNRPQKVIFRKQSVREDKVTRDKFSQVHSAKVI